MTSVRTNQRVQVQNGVTLPELGDLLIQSVQQDQLVLSDRDQNKQTNKQKGTLLSQLQETEPEEPKTHVSS